MMLPHRDKWDAHYSTIDETVYIGRDVFVVVASTLSLYNAIELLTLISLTFKRRSGLYFWSILIASFGIIPYCLGWLIVYFDLTHDYVGMIIETVGWVLVISGQSFVLYSRLHLIVTDVKILRAVLIMIIINGLVWHSTMTVLLFGSEYSPSDNRRGFNNVFNIAEKISMSIFYLQELIISGLYIWKSMEILKTAFGNTRSMLYKLFTINFVIILMDIALLAIEFHDLYVWEQGIKLVTYSIKLKLEFAVLSELIEFVRNRSGTRSRPTKNSENQSTFVPLSSMHKGNTKGTTSSTRDFIHAGDSRTNTTIAATNPIPAAHHIFVREDSSSQNKRQLAIENAFARTTARQLQQVREHERNTLRSVINVDAFREAQMLLSAHRHLPLNFVTWPEYQALLTAVNPAVQEFLTDSGNTVAADLDRAYDAHQQSVKKWLEHARSLVHIAMDVWSSPQRKAYVAVHAQWVDEAYKPRKALLGLPNLRRSHAGAAMTPHLMEIIRKYHLAPRIGYFTGDNDAKNDTCLRQLAVGLSQEYGLTFDPVSSRTRCAGHIINLSLQAFLFATSEDALQAAIEQAQDEANDVTVSDALHDRIQSNTCQKSHGRRNKRNDTAGWRSIGPMDNIAVFIRNSTVRNDAWDDIAGKALGIDNITRWNSWFKLLDAAISQEGPLSIFLNQYHEELEDDILTHDDWQVLKMAHEFLQPFYQATLEQQMEWASIDQVLENMDILFLQFENAKVKYVNNARMVNSVHMGWWVLSKYYEESDKSPIYATALLLHPEKRRRYLDRHWAEEWRQTAIAGARRHWAKYKDRPLSSDSAARLSNERREVTPYERIKQSMSVLDEPGDEDEFEKFSETCHTYLAGYNPSTEFSFPIDLDLDLDLNFSHVALLTMEPLSLALGIIPLSIQLVNTITTIKNLVNAYRSAAKEL
ncbi:hypothetical protein HZS61_006775 [Fusarium oxysporum f. sp. conglutinans]|uniref:DUF7703 domain-containing protein n=1 Tax=Fusarium oxysporum f. sp. conglutinans TaxID=100902 RepID=A0A8H6G9Q6_FUSOX|nr:hypothetical protein HZS61_006775 [Fusarium oxysporum f. sp. conglutinans]